MVFPTAGAWLYFVVLAGTDSMDLAYYASKTLQLLLPLVGWFALDMRRQAGPPERGRGLLPGLATGVGLAGAVLGAWWLLRDTGLLGEAPEVIGARLRAFGAATVDGYIVLAVALSVVHSLFEEYYWRWFVLGSLARRLHVGVAVVLSSIAFAAHHVIVVDRFVGPERFWEATVPFSIAVAVGGGIWALLFLRYRSLLASWVSHVLVDAAVMWIGYRMVWG